MYNKQHTPSSFTLSGGGSLTPSHPPRESEREEKKKLCETFPRQRGGEAE